MKKTKSKEVPLLSSRDIKIQNKMLPKVSIEDRKVVYYEIELLLTDLVDEYYEKQLLNTGTFRVELEPGYEPQIFESLSDSYDISEEVTEIFDVMIILYRIAAEQKYVPTIYLENEYFGTATKERKELEEDDNNMLLM